MSFDPKDMTRAFLSIETPTAFEKQAYEELLLAQADLAARDAVIAEAAAYNEAEAWPNSRLRAILAQSPADTLDAVKAEARNSALEEAASLAAETTLRSTARGDFTVPTRHWSDVPLAIRALSTTSIEGATP